MSAAPSRKAATTAAPRRGAERTRRAELKTVERVRSVKRSLLLGSLTIIVIGALFALAALNALLVAGQADLDAVNDQIELTERQQARLEVRVAELSAPGQIIARAEDLGMTRSAPPVHIPAVETPLGPAPVAPAPAADEAPDAVSDPGTVDGSTGEDS